MDMKELELKHIKKGDVFWENDLEYLALEDARIKSYHLSHYPQWVVVAKQCSTNQTIEFLITETLEHLGPFVYTKT